MLDPKDIEAITREVFAQIPDTLQVFELEMQSTFRDVLSTMFKELDFVTRDEYDTQVKVLLRTREKVDALELQVKDLLAKEA